jgi:ribosomal protein L44E
MKEIGTECGCLCSSAVRPPRNPRRAYDEHGREIEPMTLGNMREHGVRSVDATCEACRHETTVNVDALPDHLYMPDVALRLRCSACGSKRIITRPDWREKALGRG